MFRRVLRTSPNAAATWTNLGVLYLTENDGAKAIDALSHAIAIDPALAGAHNGLGVAYARQGDVKRAIDEWKEALRLRPDLNDARANLERVGARD
jgi:Tfp pilus assembly protein PilF